MKLDSLRRHAVVPALLGAALAALGVLHARVRHPDGTTAPDQAQFAGPDRATHGSYEHVCL